MKSVPLPPKIVSFCISGWFFGFQSPHRMSLLSPPRTVSDPWWPSSSSERRVPV